MKCYGYADIERKIPAKLTTAYRVYSMTKPFTALMLLQLVHDGKVHFSDAARKYFPAYWASEAAEPKCTADHPAATRDTHIRLAGWGERVQLGFAGRMGKGTCPRIRGHLVRL